MMTFEETCKMPQTCGGVVYTDPEDPDTSGACHIWFPIPGAPECEMIENSPGLEVVVHPGDGAQSSVIDSSSMAEIAAQWNRRSPVTPAPPVETRGGD